MNKNGELHWCDCVRKSQAEPKDFRRREVHIIEETTPKKPNTPAPETEKKTSSWVPKAAISLGSLLFGLAVGKYGNEVLKLLPKLHR